MRNMVLRSLARKRNIRVPSLVADTRVINSFVPTDEMVAAVADATEATTQQIGEQLGEQIVEPTAQTTSGDPITVDPL